MILLGNGTIFEKKTIIRAGTSRQLRQDASKPNVASLTKLSLPREINLDELPYDPVDRKRILQYNNNPKKQDEIRRRYLTRGPYRPQPGIKYPQKCIGEKLRRFNPE